MTQHPNATIRRRPDGSIDNDFYARRGANLRRTAMRETPADWAVRLGRIVARLAGTPRAPRASGAGLGWSGRGR